MSGDRAKRLRHELAVLIHESVEEHRANRGAKGLADHLAARVVNWLLEEPERATLRRREYRVFVPGVPRSWGVSTRAKNRAHGSSLKDWQREIKAAWLQTHQLQKLPGPVELWMRFYSDKPLKDLSNMVKGAEDALKGTAFDDDDRVYRIIAEKEPAVKDGCGAFISLSHFLGPAFEEHLC